MKTLTRNRAEPPTHSEAPTHRHWDTCPKVDRDSERLGGARTFGQTRLPLSAMYENLAQGASLDDIAELFPGVSKEEMQAVLEHDAQTLRDDAGWP